MVQILCGYYQAWSICLASQYGCLDDDDDNIAVWPDFENWPSCHILNIEKYWFEISTRSVNIISYKSLTFKIFMVHWLLVDYEYATYIFLW